MAKYKNTKSGVIIDTPALISGYYWEKVIAEAAEGETVEEEAELDKDLDGVTKNQIMQELDAMGIEYDPKARKQELYDLMARE